MAKVKKSKAEAFEDATEICSKTSEVLTFPDGEAYEPNIDDSPNITIPNCYTHQGLYSYLQQAMQQAAYDEATKNRATTNTLDTSEQQHQTNAIPSKDFLRQVEKGADNGGAGIFSSALYMATPLPKEAYAPYPKFSKK